MDTTPTKAQGPSIDRRSRINFTTDRCNLTAYVIDGQFVKAELVISEPAEPGQESEHAFVFQKSDLAALKSAIEQLCSMAEIEAERQSRDKA